MVDKFRFFKKIPKKVKQAWHEGWSDVKFLPNGYMVGGVDFGGLVYRPGWYGIPPNGSQGSISMICGIEGDLLDPRPVLCGSVAC